MYIVDADCVAQDATADQVVVANRNDNGPRKFAAPAFNVGRQTWESTAQMSRRFLRTTDTTGAPMSRAERRRVTGHISRFRLLAHLIAGG